MKPPPLPPPTLKSKKERLPSYTIERTKNRFRYRNFALKKKASSTEQNLAFQSRAKACYRQQGVSSSGGLTDAVCCEPHAGSCFSVSGPLQPIPGASLPLLILELFTLFRFLNSLFRSSKEIPSASLSFSSFWVDTSFVSPMFLPRRCLFFVNPEKILFVGTVF